MTGAPERDDADEPAEPRPWSPQDPRRRAKAFGGGVMVLLLLGAIFAAALPLLVGLLVGSRVPAIGELRPGTGWRLLHLLWAYPAVWLAASVVDGVSKHLGLDHARGPVAIVGRVVGPVVMWLTVTAIFGVFFAHPAGAALAALVALLIYGPFVRLLEKATPADDAEPGGRMGR